MKSKRFQIAIQWALLTIHIYDKYLKNISSKEIREKIISPFHKHSCQIFLKQSPIF